MIISGGIDFDTAVISSSVSSMKSTNSNGLRGVELLMPRFLHASVVYKSKLYVIGGKIAIAQSNGNNSSLNNSIVSDNFNNNNNSMSANTSSIVGSNGYS